MKSKYILIILFLITLFACDDSTGTLGVDMMPSTDVVTTIFTNYDVSTQSVAVGDSVLARSSISYIGRFTDPETGTTIKSDFVTQFHCNEGFALPDTIRGDSCTKVELRLYVTDFIGDSLSSFNMVAYELDESLDPNADYYTNIDPTKYYDSSKKPLSSKWYTLADHTISDSLRYVNNTNKTQNITLVLPNEIGTQIIKGYKEHPEYFENQTTWSNSGLPLSKGVYFKLESGDGAVASIDICQLNMYFKYYDTEYAKDTTGVVQFAATEEVIQATRFENSNLHQLIDDTNATYIKSPAGIFTMATIPTESINSNDTINSAKLVFTRYNDEIQSSFKLDIPQKLLLIRLNDYENGFFEKYLLPDNISSYITSFNSSTNTYEYSNISKLITLMLEEKKNGTADENWNKVLLIPVETVESTDNSTSSSVVVKMNHDFSMSSTRLVGGEKDKVNMEVIYTRFNTK